MKVYLMESNFGSIINLNTVVLNREQKCRISQSLIPKQSIVALI